MTLDDIEAALPALSTQELLRIETTLHRLQSERCGERCLNGQPWPATSSEIAAMLAELDALPPVLTPVEAERFETWRAAEKERQKMRAAQSGERIGQLFT